MLKRGSIINDTDSGVRGRMSDGIVERNTRMVGKHVTGAEGAIVCIHATNCAYGVMDACSSSSLSSCSSLSKLFVQAPGYFRRSGKHTASMSRMTAASRSANAACKTIGKITSLLRSSIALSRRQSEDSTFHARCRAAGDPIPSA